MDEDEAALLAAQGLGAAARAGSRAAGLRLRWIAAVAGGQRLGLGGGLLLARLARGKEA